MIVLSALLGFLLPLPLRAELGSKAATLADLSLEVRHWGMDEGVPGGRIDVIAQSPDGYLWIGGWDFLSRFNGYSFASENPAKALGQEHRRVVNLEVDAGGSVWMASLRNQLVTERDGKLALVDGTADMGTLILLVRHETDGVLAVYARDGRSTIHHVTASGLDKSGTPLTVEGSIKALVIDPDGSRWYSTQDRHLFRSDPAGADEPEPHPEGDDGLLFARFDGSPALLFPDRLMVRDGTSWKSRLTISSTLRPPGDPFRVVEDPWGSLFLLCTDQSLVRVDPGGNTEALPTGRGEAPQPITDILAGRSGCIWLASFNGLYQLRYSPFVNLEPPESVATSQVSTIGEENTGRLWFSCFGAICYRDPKGPALEVFAKTHPSEIHMFSPGSEGGIWIGGRSGNYSFHQNGTEQKFSPPSGVFTRTDSLVDDRGTLWVTGYPGLYCLDRLRDKAFVRERVGNLPDSTAFQTITANKAGALFVQAKGFGIYRKLAGSSGWHRFTPENDPLAYRVGTMAVDKDGCLWGLSEPLDGIACWTGEEALHGPVRELGIGENRVTGLIFDDFGGAWFASNRNGVARVSRTELRAKLRTPSATLKVTWFDQSYGLGSKNGPFTPAGFHEGSDGRLWVATSAGASVIDPRLWTKRQQESISPPIHIESIIADGSPLPFHHGARPLRLPLGTETLLIRSAALDFGRPAEAIYRYELEGTGSRFVQEGANPVFELQRLPPGDYRLAVSATNRDGARSVSPARLAFVMPPRWWQRPVVRFSAAILVIAVLVMFYQLRIRAYRRRQAVQLAFSQKLIDSQEDERKRIAGELHDSLGQHLLLIKNSTELARRKLDPGSPVGPRLEEVSGIAAEALKDVRSITNNLRPAELDRLGLRIATQSMVERVAEHSRFQIIHNLVGLDRDWLPAQQIAIYRIIQEGLNNAIKHADASRIRVEAVAGRSSLQVRIEDDGKGFDPAKSGSKAARLGLTGMGERASFLKGAFKIDSMTGRGTRLLITIPLTSA